MPALTLPTRPRAHADRHAPATMPTTLAEPAADLTALSPEDLARRVQRGSSACFAQLVERFEGRVYNFLLRRVPTAADAEDLTQDTFVRVWQRIETYDSTRGFSTWLFTIASRLASSHRRTAARDTRRRASATPPSAVLDPAARAGSREHAGRVWALVDQLSDDQRSALWLRYVEDMPIADIARVLGKSSVGVRVCLFRARKALADRLGVEGQNQGGPPLRGGSRKVFVTRDQGVK